MEGLRITKDERRLAHYERTKGRKRRKACALRKNEQGLRLTKERKRKWLTHYEKRRMACALRKTKTKTRRRLEGRVFVMQWFRNEEYIIQPRKPRKPRNYICLQLLFLMAKRPAKKREKAVLQAKLGLPHCSLSYNLAGLIILANFTPFAVILNAK